MTLTTLRSLLRDYVQESSTTPLSNALANDMLNQGQEALAVYAEYKFGKFLVSGGLVTNQMDYSLPSELITAYSVSIYDVNSDLVHLGAPTSLAQMEIDYPTWRVDDGDQPLRWWVTQDVLWFHPKPSATWNATPVEILGTLVPPDMSADTDTPVALPRFFHRTLAKYAAAKWLAMDNENPTAIRMSQFWMGEYQKDAERLRQVIFGRLRMDDDRLRVEVGRDTGGIALDDDEVE